jgi:hypothetical protein
MADSFDDRLNAFTPIICIRNKKKKSPVGDRVRAGQTKKKKNPESLTPLLIISKD